MRLLASLALPCSPPTWRSPPAQLPQLEAWASTPGWCRWSPCASATTWQIGTASISALLVKTDAGAVLIDGGMPQVADHLLANMKKLGVAPQDVRLILHSHAHIDHVGPLAAIKRATGAMLVSNAESAVLLQRGGANDIHFGSGMLFEPIQTDRLVQDGEAVTLGDTTFTVHFTRGTRPAA